MSPCGRERNYIRCDDVPIVYTHILPDQSGNEFLSFGYAGELLKVDFEPNKIHMSLSGKVYHPAGEKYGGIGLIRSKLAIELSKHFEFADGEENAPSGIRWNQKLFSIDNTWLSKAVIFKPL